MLRLDFMRWGLIRLLIENWISLRLVVMVIKGVSVL